MTNNDLAQIVETSDEWISTRTGIKSRHIVEDETTSDLIFNAAQMALSRAGISAQELDLILVASITPDNTTPSVAAKVSNRLGTVSGTICFDISAACSGFVYGLTMADNMIRLGQIKTALVVGAESLSKIVDWTDRNTCVLFGDGAGAVVLRASEGEGTNADHGILATKLFADGSHYDSLKTTGGVSTTKNAGFVFMDGKEVFKGFYKLVALRELFVRVPAVVEREADEGAEAEILGDGWLRAAARARDEKRREAEKRRGGGKQAKRALRHKIRPLRKNRHATIILQRRTLSRAGIQKAARPQRTAALKALSERFFTPRRRGGAPALRQKRRRRAALPRRSRSAPSC